MITAYTIVASFLATSSYIVRCVFSLAGTTAKRPRTPGSTTPDRLPAVGAALPDTEATGTVPLGWSTAAAAIGAADRTRCYRGLLWLLL